MQKNNDLQNGVRATMKFLEMFFSNFILGKELVTETGKSLSTIKRIVESLQRKEYIRRMVGKR